MIQKLSNSNVQAILCIYFIFSNFWCFLSYTHTVLKFQFLETWYRGLPAVAFYCSRLETSKWVTSKGAEVNLVNYKPIQFFDNILWFNTVCKLHNTILHPIAIVFDEELHSTHFLHWLWLVRCYTRWVLGLTEEGFYGMDGRILNLFYMRNRKFKVATFHNNIWHRWRSSQLLKNENFEIGHSTTCRLPLV